MEAAAAIIEHVHFSALTFEFFISREVSAALKEPLEGTAGMKRDDGVEPFLESANGDFLL